MDLFAGGLGVVGRLKLCWSKLGGYVELHVLESHLHKQRDVEEHLNFWMVG